MVPGGSALLSPPQLRPAVHNSGGKGTSTCSVDFASIPVKHRVVNHFHTSIEKFEPNVSRTRGVAVGVYYRGHRLTSGSHSRGSCKLLVVGGTRPNSRDSTNRDRIAAYRPNHPFIRPSKQLKCRSLQTPSATGRYTLAKMSRIGAQGLLAVLPGDPQLKSTPVQPIDQPKGSLIMHRTMSCVRAAIAEMKLNTNSSR